MSLLTITIVILVIYIIYYIDKKRTYYYDKKYLIHILDKLMEEKPINQALQDMTVLKTVYPEFRSIIQKYINDIKINGTIN